MIRWKSDEAEPPSAHFDGSDDFIRPIIDQSAAANINEIATGSDPSTFPRSLDVINEHDGQLLRLAQPQPAEEAFPGAVNFTNSSIERIGNLVNAIPNKDGNSADAEPSMVLAHQKIASTPWLPRPGPVSRSTAGRCPCV